MIKKLWCIYTMDSYSAIEEEIVQFVTTWVELKSIRMSEVSQIERDRCRIISLVRRRERSIIRK